MFISLHIKIRKPHRCHLGKCPRTRRSQEREESVAEQQWRSKRKAARIRWTGGKMPFWISRRAWNNGKWQIEGRVRFVSWNLFWQISMTFPWRYLEILGKFWKLIVVSKSRTLCDDVVLFPVFCAFPERNILFLYLTISRAITSKISLSFAFSISSIWVNLVVRIKTGKRRVQALFRSIYAFN